MQADERAAAALNLLSDETRVGILRAVAEAQAEAEGPNAGPAELTFSEIYEHVDVDSTSKLSYHLGELAGTFLRKSEDGYSFTHAGEQITRFVLSANFERMPEFEPTATNGQCPFCGEAALEARLHHQFFFVVCTGCGEAVSGVPITPAQVRSRDEEAAIRAVKRRLALEYAQVRRGICPECAGRLTTDVQEVPDLGLPIADGFVVRDRCEECLRRYNALLTYSVAYHPASIAFHWGRGIDMTSKGLWEFHEHLQAGRWTSEQVETDPAEYEVVLRHEDDALRCRLDAEASVLRTERVQRR